MMPIGFHVGSPLATRWAPWNSNWGPLLCPRGPHAIPIWVPIGLRLAPHGIPIGCTHCMSMRFPWGPQWDPLGFPCGPHRCFSMRCTCGVSLLPGWFPFPRFSAETVFLVASLVASAPGQCGGAQPGMPCLGKHIVSIPPGMVFALLQLPNERRCCVHAITIGFPVDCTYIYIYQHWDPWVSI